MPPRRQPAARVHQPGRQARHHIDPNANPGRNNRARHNNPAEGQGNNPNPPIGDGGQDDGANVPNNQRVPANGDQQNAADGGNVGPGEGDGHAQNGQNPNANPIQQNQRVVRTVMADTTPAPITADSPVFLRANDPLVRATPFLGWATVPGAPPRVSLASFQMFKVFATRCRIGPQDGDKAAAATLSVLQLRLTEDAWSRVLSCLVDGGLLTNPFSDLLSFMEGISRLVIPDTTPLEIGANDWENGEKFSIPAPPAAEAVTLQPLLYLSYVTVGLLENDINTTHPWEDLCYLVGALGPCLTQHARALVTSSVQLISQKLRVFLGGAAISDGAAARGLGDALPNLRLPTLLRSASVRESDLRLEFVDSIQYYSATTAGRSVIEARRVTLLGTR